MTSKDKRLILSGDEWKQLRKIFNPAFSPKSLVETTLPKICDKALIFVRNLETLAKKGEEFRLQEHAQVVEFFSFVLIEGFDS